MNQDRCSVPLTNLQIGSHAQIVNLQAAGASRRRLLDLGLVPGSKIEAVRKSPAGDPIAYRIRGAVIALRREEASQVSVEILTSETD